MNEPTRNEDRMNFREWTSHYEKEQESQREQIGELTKNVSSLTADVRTLIDNQRGMFSRMNRPQPVAAYVSALLASVAVMISFATLLVAPLRQDYTDMKEVILLEAANDLELHIMMKEDIEDNLVANARQDEALRWMEKIEDRYNERVHSGVGR